MNTPTRLSYSSMKELQSCQTKYWHRKIAGTSVDPDHEESDALGIGKAFHKVLEDNMHEKYTKEEVIKSCEEFEVVDEIPMVEAMISKYIDYHKLCGLKVVKCELQIITSTFTGFIDAIAVDDSSWWIIDLKTSARFDESILSRLAKDPQLNLYAYFADDIKNLSPELIGDRTFAGCRYRVTTKTKSVSQDVTKLKQAIKVFDVVIPADKLDVKTAMSVFLEQHDIAEQLHQGVAPKRNYGACMDYFKPCAYFSQCYGHTFTDNKGKVTVLTEETFKSGDLL